MAKVKDVKKAITVLENAKKQVIAVLGDMASLSFLPLESSLQAELERAEAHNPFEGLSEEEIQELKDSTRKKELERLENEANESLAKIMEARSGKKVEPADLEESTEPDGGSAEPDGGSAEPDGGSAETDGGSAKPDGGSAEPDGGSTDQS